MKNTSWVQSMLQDSDDGSVSSKRVVTLLAFIMCSIAFMVDIFTDYEVKVPLFDSMIYLVIAGLGFTASEKFIPRRHRNNGNYDSENTET